MGFVLMTELANGKAYGWNARLGNTQKGDLRGVLTVKETTMNWDVFSDPDFSQHLNWNHPECFPDFHKNRQHLNPLHFVSMLIENGWKSIENR